MRQKLSRLPEPPQRPYLQKQDWLGAFAVFLVIAVATLPVVMPFALIEDAKRALRVSNGLAVLMLFLTGYAFGRSAGHRPFAMAFTMVIMGAALVAITISLGG
jgi:VIT1/CCC1 family predicted Fe2+/Mn2+ transporter